MSKDGSTIGWQVQNGYTSRPGTTGSVSYNPESYRYGFSRELDDYINAAYMGRQQRNIGSRTSAIGENLDAYRDASDLTTNQMYDTALLRQRQDALNRITDRDLGAQLSAMDTDMGSAERGYAGQMGASSRAMREAGSDFESGMMSTANANVKDQFGVARSNLGTQEDIYSRMGGQSDAAINQLTRMSGEDYSTDLLNRRLDDTLDQTEARMNALGLRRSGATAEAFAEAQADLAAEQADRDWQRDMSIAQMRANIGSEGSAGLSRASDVNAQMLSDAYNRRMQAAMEGRAGAMDANMQAAQNQMVYGRDVFGVDAENLQREMDARQQATAVRQGAADAYYSDAFGAQQGLGQARLGINADLVNARNQNLGRYYQDLFNLDRETATMGADADLNARIRQANIDIQHGNTASNLYGQQASRYSDMAGGLYDLAGTAAMTGLTTGAEIYANRNKD
jgi:hypothetical protein